MTMRSFAETGANVPLAAGTSLRLTRQWKVQNTGTPGAVTVAFDLTNAHSYRYYGNAIIVWW